MSYNIVWWNIEQGLTNKHRGDNALNRNLQVILESRKVPDVIALGEFRYSSLDGKTLQTLRKNYHEVFVPYNTRTPELGIAVFAKGEVEVFPFEHLDWTSESLKSESEREAYRRKWFEIYADTSNFSRQYIRLRIRRPDGSVINVIPQHLLQVWDVFTEQYGKAIGSAVIGMSLVFGSENPLMYQLHQLKKKLVADFGPNLDREPMVLLGDFNVPKQILFKKTPAYEKLSFGLKDAFSEQAATFPAEGASSYGKYPPMQIDHAFASENVSVQSGRVMKLEGSDHYPIQLSVVFGNEVKNFLRPITSLL